MEWLQLLLLIGVNYWLVCIGVLLFLSVTRFNTMIQLLSKLDKPTKEEIIGKMTITEAQKEAIRVREMLLEQYQLVAKIIRKELVDAFGGK